MGPFRGWGGLCGWRGLMRTTPPPEQVPIPLPLKNSIDLRVCVKMLLTGLQKTIVGIL